MTNWEDPPAYRPKSFPSSVGGFWVKFGFLIFSFTFTFVTWMIAGRSQLFYNYFSLHVHVCMKLIDDLYKLLKYRVATWKMNIRE